MFQILSSSSGDEKWLGQSVLLAFIVKIVLIGLWFFLTPGFMSMNVNLELILHENFWSLLILLYIFTSVYCVCMCVYLYRWTYIHVYTPILTYVFRLVLSFFSLAPWVECKIVCLCVYVYIHEFFCMKFCFVCLCEIWLCLMQI